MRIGLISDTHIPEARKELFPEIVDAFRGVELILHAGDINLPRVLDDLERAAPILAAEGNHDLYATDPRIKKYHLLEREGFSIALTHRLEPYNWELGKLIDQWLGGNRTDIIIFGDTHYEKVEVRDGILVVNPGSAMYPRNKSTRLGHIGYLDLERGKEPKVQIVDLGQLYPVAAK